MSDYNLPGKPLRLHEFDFISFSKELYDKNIKFTDGRRVGEVVIDGVPQFIGLSAGQKEVIESEARFKVLAAGRRFGKCQDIDSTVQLADGSIHRIGDLIGKEVQVNAMDDDYNYVKTQAAVHYNAKVPVYRIKTKYGSELVRTGNHPLYTSLGWGSIDTGELKEGTRIAFPTNNPNIGTETFDKNQLALLGLMLGDGSLSGKNFMFTLEKSREAAVSDFEELLDGTFKKYEYDNKSVVQYNLHHNNSIYNLCKESGLLGTNSHTKFIPSWVFKLDKEHIAHFLSYLFFTDGWYYDNKGKCNVGYCSASKELAQGVRTLLQRVGVVSSLRVKTVGSGRYSGNEYYTVDILNNKEVEKFENRVGIKHKKPIYTGRGNSFNSQLTTMPKEFCRHFAGKLREQVSFHSQEKAHGRVRPDRSSSKARMIKYCNDYSGHFEEEIKLLESDLYWDEIVEIEYLGERHTAHLDVPKYHNYVNEAIEHNSKLAALLVLAAMFQPNRLVILVGPEHTHVEKVFKEVYYILVRQLGLAQKGDGISIIRNTKGDYVIQLKNGSRVEGKSGTNPDSLAGDAVDLYIFDEAALEENLDHLWSLARPALSDNRGSAIFISSPRGRNDFYRLFKLGQKGKGQREGYIPLTEADDMTDWDSWTYPSYSNPFISSEEYHIAKREAVEKGKYEKFKQEWDADFDAVTDVAFPEFRAFKKEEDENGNIYRKPYHVQHYKFDPSNGPWFASCDFNVARPASTVYIQIDKNNNVMIFDELFKPQTDAKLQAQYILEKQNQLGVPYRMVFGDVAGGFSRAGVNEFTLMEGVLGHSPYAERQSRDSGKHLIHQFLAVPHLDEEGKLIVDEFGAHSTYPKLFVASHCVETIHAFEAAKRKMTKDGSIKDDYKEFKTGHEGLLDAVRYALVCIFKPKNGMQVYKGL